jgi:hypothetical protein
MERKTRNRWLPVWASLAVAFMLFCIYVGGYFALTERWVNISGLSCRDYRTKFLATAFRPCARVESAITGQEVGTCSMQGLWQAIGQSR